MNRDRWDVIVTNASTRVAYTILRSLARSGLRVGLGVDSNSGMAVYSRYCAGTFRHPSPFHDPLGFMVAVREALQLHRPAVYIPVDEDVFVVSEHLEMLNDLPVRLAVAPAATLQRLDNKHEALQLAASLGIPIPVTLRPSTLEEIIVFSQNHPGALVLKLIRSSGARGVHVILPGDLAGAVPRILKRHGCDFGDFIVQEFISAPGYGVSALCDGGTVKVCIAHRRLRERSPAGGPSTLRESVRLPVLEEYATRVLQSAGHHGVAMVEFKHDEAAGKTWFLEVNPRWWGSLALAVRAGVDFPVLFHQMVLGQAVLPLSGYKPGVKVRWLLGDLLALKNHVVAGRLSSYGPLWPAVDGYDDAHADDPLALGAELYLSVRKNLFRALRKKSRFVP